MLKLSYVKGNTDIPLIEKSIGAFFEDQVEKYSKSEILRVVYQNIRWNWEELDVSQNILPFHSYFTGKSESIIHSIN